MTLSERYRAEYNNPRRPMETVADWLYLLKEIDPKASMSSRDLGIYIEFTDGSIWRLGAANHALAPPR